MRVLIAIVALLAASPAFAQFGRIFGTGSSGAGGGSTPITEALGQRNVRMTIAQFETATDFEFGLGTTIIGTASAITLTTTDYGKYSRFRITSPAAINSVSAYTMNAYGQAVGPIRIDGSAFKAWAQLGIPNGYVAGNRGIFGLINTLTGSIAGNVEPSAVTQTVYFGFNAADANWQVCSNSAAGAATCVDLGVPITTAGMFHMEFSNTGEGSVSFDYRFKRIDAAGIDLAGTIATDLPTVPIRPYYQISSGTSALAVLLEPHKMYMEMP